MKLRTYITWIFFLLFSLNFQSASASSLCDGDSTEGFKAILGAVEFCQKETYTRGSRVRINFFKVLWESVLKKIESIKDEGDLAQNCVKTIKVSSEEINELLVDAEEIKKGYNLAKRSKDFDKMQSMIEENEVIEGEIFFRLGQIEEIATIGINGQ